MAAPLYDAKNFNISVGGIIITGVADDSFFELDIPDWGVEGMAGAYGEAGRIVKNKQIGTLKLTLLQWSASNEYLSSLIQSDLTLYTGARDIIIQDNIGTTFAHLVNGYVKRWPNIKRGVNAENVEWELEFLNVQQLVVGTQFQF